MTLKAIQSKTHALGWGVFDNHGKRLFTGSIEDASSFYNRNKDEVIEEAYLINGVLVDKDRNILTSTASTASTATGWKDLCSPFASAKTRGTTEPSWEDIGNGIFLYRFTDGEEIFAQYHIGHDYKQGTLAYLHIHFLTKYAMAENETVEWTFEHTIARGHHQGDSLNGDVVTTVLTYTADGTEVAGEHIVLECKDEQAIDLIEPDTVVLLRIIKSGGTHSRQVFGIMADIHYQSDVETTINKAPNFYE